MAMMEKMKEKLPGVKGKAEAPDMMEKKKAMPGIEIEIGEDESEGEAEDSLASESEAEEEVAVGELAKLSDEELLAEVKKRGLSAEAPEAPEEPAKA